MKKWIRFGGTKRCQTTAVWSPSTPRSARRSLYSIFERPSDQFHDLIMMSHWLGKTWIRIRDIFNSFTFILFRLENCISLSCGAQVAGATWRAATSIAAGIVYLVRRTGNGQTQVGYSVAGRSEVGWRCVRSASCTWRWGVWVSWLSLKIKVDGLSVV
jgi:hypothetical protein